MDKKLGIGSLYCKICGQTFQAPINGKLQMYINFPIYLLTYSTVLSAPIDVYSEWIDACEAVAEETQETGGSRYSDRERDDVRQSGGESEQDDYDEY